MNMYYEQRNLNNLNKLAKHTKQAALKWYEYCKSKGYNILIYETIRTLEQQKANVASGASKTLKSYHLVGQALDFVPVNSKGVALWGIKDYTTKQMLDAINYAKKLGFTWGGDWNNNGEWRDEKFLDSPHLQFNHTGYGKDVFDGKTSPSINDSITKLSKEQATNIQRRLNRILNTKLVTDGIFGKASKDALKKFQSEYGLTADGLYGPKTERRIGALISETDYDKQSEHYKYRVKLLQNDLNRLQNAKLIADGIYGTATKNAVYAYEQKNGFNADGIVGTKVLALLNKQCGL